MFTGLIQEIGKVREIRRQGAAARFWIDAPGMAGDLAVGESVAVNGACMTVEQFDSSAFQAYASDETLSRTTLGKAGPGSMANLERALRLGDRLGGHLVSGHVDATGRIAALEPREEGWLLRVAAPESILSVSTPKGSIAVDGISLTLVDVDAGEFSVAVIPQTWRETTLSRCAVGQGVNLESDLIGKYVSRLLGTYRPDASASDRAKDERLMRLLAEGGFMGGES